MVEGASVYQAAVGLVLQEWLYQYVTVDLHIMKLLPLKPHGHLSGMLRQTLQSTQPDTTSLDSPCAVVA